MVGGVVIVVVTFFVAFLGWFYIRTRKPKNFPPGPPRLPMVGSFPYMTGSGDVPSLLQGVSDQVTKYGPIFGFYFGSTPAVILADYDLIKEAMKLDALAARPDLNPARLVRRGHEYMSRSVNGGVPGVIFSHGNYWKELRRFMLRHLRDFGFGKTSMEDLFQDEVEKLCKVLSKRCDVPISLAGTMNISIVNALWSVLVGEKLDLEDPNLIKVVTLVNNLINGPAPMNVTTAIMPHPIMATWPIISNFSGHKRATQTFNEIYNLVIPYVEEHERTIDPDNIRDFLDLMIVEHQKTTDPGSCFYGQIGKAAIVNSIVDLFLAGMETTTTSLLVITLHLLHHPEVLKKVHEEIDTVVGRGRLPSLADRDNMPYTNAVLLESLRVGSLAYLGVPHHALEDVKIGQYTIPKGATVMSSLYHAMHDPKLFENPDFFDPSRFIDENGKFVHDDHVIPFGLGKRYCLGQSLAEKEFFIFFTGFMQQFDVRHAPGTTLPSYIDIYPRDSLIRNPTAFKVILKKRF